MRAARIVLVLLLAGGLVARGGNGADGEVLARGEGVVITRAHLEEEQKCRMAEVARMKTEMPAATVDGRILSSLINKHLLLARATDVDRKAGLEKFRLNLADHKATLKLSDGAFEERLRRRLPLWRLSRARWEERNVENCIMQVVLNREVEAVVTEDQIQAYYEEHPGRFARPETVWAQVIFLGTVDASTGRALTEERKALKRREAEELRQRASGGADFAQLVRQYSELPPTRDEGGAHALVRGRLAAELEAAVFGLEAGQTSEAVASDNGYYLFRSVAKSPAKTLSLAEVKTQARTSVALSLIPSYLERLRRDAAVVILDAELAAEARIAAGKESDLEHLADPRL